jgi:hypothetical protein
MWVNGGEAASKGAAWANWDRTRANKSWSAASYARCKAVENANSSADPWLLNTKPCNPNKAAPL